MLNGSNKDSDSSSEDIISKVEEILLGCKEIKPLGKDDRRTSRPQLCSKWLALLTMEKACLSGVALEETSDKVPRVGGDFKETLRVSGGLDNIFDVMIDCHSALESGENCKGCLHSVLGHKRRNIFGKCCAPLEMFEDFRECNVFKLR
ncbi:hypothetical protein ACQ4PT_022875 [Festuca glaucescens]